MQIPSKLIKCPILVKIIYFSVIDYKKVNLVGLYQVEDACMFIRKQGYTKIIRSKRLYGLTPFGLMVKIILARDWAAAL